nr:MAG TPA: carbohydrate esterase [Caudoviricetes sp.]
MCLFLNILHSKILLVLGQSNMQEALMHILVQLNF